MTTEPPNIFPATAHTWLEDQLEHGEGGHALAREHVMAVYHEPLMIYIKGSSYRSMGEPADLVQGFFHSRLSREDYLDRWVESRLPLRVWLIKGLKFYLLERTRPGWEDRRERLPADGGVGDGAEELDGPASDYRKQLARNLVREAMRVTGDELEAEGLGEHWHVFVQHHIDGVSYAAIARSSRVTEERAAVMARTAGRRLRKRLRQMCSWPGATEAEVDHELVSMFD